MSILLSSSLRDIRRAWLWRVHAVDGPVRAASAVGRPKADQIKRCAATRFEHRTKRRGGIGSTRPYVDCLLLRRGAAFPAREQICSFSSGAAEKRAKLRGGAELQTLCLLLRGGVAFPRAGAVLQLFQRNSGETSETARGR